MARPTPADWLDKVILDALPGKAPKTDFDAWRAAHTDAIRRLKQRGAEIPAHVSRLRAIAMLGIDATRRPIVRLAAAASLILASFILATHCLNRAPAPTGTTVVTMDPTDSPAPSEPEIVKRELVLANELFQEGDARGLLSLLDTARPRATGVIAAYLGQIGDISSVPTLDAFAARWSGPPEDNPFQKALTEIRDRHEQSRANPVVVPSPPAAGPPLAVSQPPAREESPARVCRGLVTDQAGKPIPKALVWAQSYTKTRKLTDIATPVLTDARGRFILPVPADGREVQDRLYLLCTHPDYALGWVRPFADPAGDATEDCEIILCRPTVVAGTVVDSQGLPVPGALVEARIAAADHPARVHEYPYTAENGRAVKTDPAGRFALGDIPVGSVLSLLVFRRGYCPYDSRRTDGFYSSRPTFLDPQAHNVRAGQQDLRIELAPASGEIDGRIVQENGSPYDQEVALLCEQAETQPDVIRCGYADGKWTLWDRWPQGSRSGVGGGRFRIEGLIPGNYYVAAADPVSGDLLTAPVEVHIVEFVPRSRVTLRVRRPTEVTVRVTDQKSGTRVGGALVVADCAMRTQKSTDPNGLCVFPLIPGNYSVTAHGWVRSTKVAALRVSPGMKDLRVDIRADVLPLLRGTLVDELGLPLQGCICLRPEQRVWTDAEGRFVIPQGASDAVGLARDVAGTRGRLFWWRASSQDAELNLRIEPMAVLAGRILDASGHPIRQTSATFWFSGQSSRTGGYRPVEHLKFRSYLADGRFQLEVPVGLPVVLRVSLPGCSGQSEPIDPAAGQTHDLGDIRAFPPGSSPQP